jgi:hypothetical protein
MSNLVDDDVVVRTCREAARREQHQYVEDAKAAALGDVLSVALADYLGEFYATEDGTWRRNPEALKRLCSSFAEFARSYGMTALPAREEIVASWVLARYDEKPSISRVIRELKAVDQWHLLARHGKRSDFPLVKAAMAKIEFADLMMRKARAIQKDTPKHIWFAAMDGASVEQLEAMAKEEGTSRD